jgi:hypothetical protein
VISARPATTREPAGVDFAAFHRRACPLARTNVFDIRRLQWRFVSKTPAGSQSRDRVGLDSLARFMPAFWKERGAAENLIGAATGMKRPAAPNWVQTCHGIRNPSSARLRPVFEHQRTVEPDHPYIYYGGDSQQTPASAPPCTQILRHPQEKWPLFDGWARKHRPLVVKVAERLRYSLDRAILAMWSHGSPRCHPRRARAPESDFDAANNSTPASFHRLPQRAGVPSHPAPVPTGNPAAFPPLLNLRRMLRANGVLQGPVKLSASPNQTRSLNCGCTSA